MNHSKTKSTSQTSNRNEIKNFLYRGEPRLEPKLTKTKVSVFQYGVAGKSILRVSRRTKRKRSLEEVKMSATYTIDVFMTLDGYASYGPGADWGGYWGKQGPEFLDHRLAIYSEKQRMVLGANTFRQFAKTMGPKNGVMKELDPVNSQMRNLPTTVISTTLESPVDWPDATVIRGDAVEAVAKLKEESDIPLRSHGSLSMNRALLAAGLVEKIQLTIFPVISGQTGEQPVFKDAADFDLILIENKTLDGNTIELTYQPALHKHK